MSNARIKSLEAALAKAAAEHTRIHWELLQARADAAVDPEDVALAQAIVQAGRKRRGEIQ